MWSASKSSTGLKRLRPAATKSSKGDIGTPPNEAFFPPEDEEHVHLDGEPKQPRRIPRPRVAEDSEAGRAEAKFLQLRLGHIQKEISESLLNLTRKVHPGRERAVAARP